MRSPQIGLGLVLAALGATGSFGCRGRGSEATEGGDPVGVAEASRAASTDQAAPGSGPPSQSSSWGPPVPPATPELLRAELARRGADPTLLSDEAGHAGRVAAEHERTLWSLARIGHVDARERLLVELDAAEPVALAAAALLEVPRTEAGSPADPLEGSA